MAGKLISDLNSGTLSLADAMEIDKDVSGTRTSFKTTVKDIVDFANHNVAEEYDSTSTYAIGDYVMYESTLYKCITAVSSAENFDSTKWTAVLVTDEMGSGGGGGTGGHTIIDENGNSMTARSGLQFFGAVEVTDDSANNRTLVEVLGGDFYNPVIYSTEERVIGVWKDGRPLYQKTVDFGALPNDSTKTVSYNISDLDYFVKIQCVAHNQNGSRNIPFVDDAYKSGDVLLDTIKSSGVIRIIAHTDLSSLTGDVTLRYVKSSDTAGSGSWTPQGVPAVHYTTDEHIVGTWMGETLWEKTYDFSSNPISIPSSSNFMTSDIDSSNMGVITNVFASHSDGTLYNDMSADPTGNNHTKLKLKSVGGATAYYLTLQYTKTS